MFPPIFQLCNTSAAVTALLGKTPLRVYPFGEAPQNVITPYLVWQIIGGSPENYLGNRPDIDGLSVQIDIYADNERLIMPVVIAVRDAIESAAHIVAWHGSLRDPQTTRYRFSFSADFIIPR